MRLLAHFLDAELAEVMRNGIQVRAIGRLEKLPPAVAERVRHAVERHARQPRDDARLRALVRRARRDRRRRAQAAARRRAGQGRSRAARREDLRRLPLRPRAPRSGSADPHRRRAARLELPALADRLRRDLLDVRDVARFPQEPSGGGDPRLPEARAPLRPHEPAGARGRACGAERGARSGTTRAGAGGAAPAHDPRQHGQRRRADARRRGGLPRALPDRRRSRPGATSRSWREQVRRFRPDARLGRRRRAAARAARAARRRSASRSPSAPPGSRPWRRTRRDLVRLRAGRRGGARARRSPRSAPAATSRSRTRKCW